jgi:hypothetical protein
VPAQKRDRGGRRFRKGEGGGSGLGTEGLGKGKTCPSATLTLSLRDGAPGCSAPDDKSVGLVAQFSTMSSDHAFVSLKAVRSVRSELIHPKAYEVPTHPNVRIVGHPPGT